jgi:hypothetical protein
MRKIKKKLTASWEIISMAEWLEKLDRNPTNDELIEWYKGDFMPMYLTRQVGKSQVWNLKIETKSKNDDGEVCEHEMNWSFDKPMSMHEVLNGANHIKIDNGGIKTRWNGVTKNWLKELDADLDDSWLAYEAKVTAWCITETTAKNIMANKFCNLIMGVSQ